MNLELARALCLGELGSQKYRRKRRGAAESRKSGPLVKILWKRNSLKRTGNKKQSTTVSLNEMIAQKCDKAEILAMSIFIRVWFEKSGPKN